MGSDRCDAVWVPGISGTRDRQFLPEQHACSSRFRSMRCVRATVTHLLEEYQVFSSGHCLSLGDEVGIFERFECCDRIDTNDRIASGYGGVIQNHGEMNVR